MLFDYWHDAHVASLMQHDGGIPGHDGSIGPEYLMNDAGSVSLAHGPAQQGHQNPGAPEPTVHGNSNSGGSGSTNPITHSTQLSVPAPTLVGSANGMQIDLIWDSSVATAPSGFQQAVIDAAQYYTTVFANKEVINIDVGWGEIAGSSLSPSALGESESYGYLTNYTTATNALAHDGLTFSATNEPTHSQFFVTSADAKALGLANPSTGLDGYVGFSTLTGTGYSWNLAASASGSNTGTGPTQFDLQSVALHEISEVMGRIGMEGATVNGQHTDTPLDLFNYQGHGVLELSGAGGYFSLNDGTTHLGVFNNASAYGGDIADWASATSPAQSQTQGLPTGVRITDANDAFLFPDYNGDVSQSDILEETALGYRLTPSGVALA